MTAPSLSVSGKTVIDATFAWDGWAGGDQGSLQLVCGKKCNSICARQDAQW